MSSIRVVVADDQRILREALSTILDATPDIQVVGVAANGPEAARLVAETEADVVLMDVRMPGGDGLDGTRMVRALAPRCRVLMLTTYADEQAARLALAEGAVGFLLKDIPLESLLGAIRGAVQGHTLIDPSMAKSLLTTKEEDSPGELTPREREILRLVAEGYANREIAAALYLTEGTVKNHLSHIYAKLNAKRRTEALKSARTRGLLGDADPPVT
jgi:DNA-binding NarL/FixJ family response regulator